MQRDAHVREGSIAEIVWRAERPSDISTDQADGDLDWAHHTFDEVGVDTVDRHLVVEPDDGWVAFIYVVVHTVTTILNEQCVCHAGLRGGG